MISDRGTYSIVHLARMRREGFDALCSAPWDDFRELYNQNRKTLKWNRASYLSLEQQRRRRQGDLSQEHYELAVVRHRLTDPQTKQDFPIRVIFIFSTVDQKVVRQRRAVQIEKIQTELTKIHQSVVGGNRNTDPASITRRVERAFGRKQAAKYFAYEMIPLAKKQQAALPAPGRGRTRPTYRFDFQFDKKLQKQDEPYDGLNALVTTTMQRSTDELFTTFKQQSYAEHANHIFKGPLSVRPVFFAERSSCGSVGVSHDDEFDVVLRAAADVPCDVRGRRLDARPPQNDANDLERICSLHVVDHANKFRSPCPTAPTDCQAARFTSATRTLDTGSTSESPSAPSSALTSPPPHISHAPVTSTPR